MRARSLAAAILIGAPLVAAAQGAQVPFGGLKHDPTAQVEITADGLTLDQAAGTAVFAGDVKVGQGALRMAADRLEVFYADRGGEGTGAVERMLASGNVTLSSGAEAAEAERATYDVTAGTILMEGDVLLTQGANALSSERLSIDLNAGTGALDGRVRTIFTPGAPDAAR
jgi:lipopolysaccharide export system protein LptA